MRPATDEFEPGFGSVFWVDFDSTQVLRRSSTTSRCAKASFGANGTIALPYAQLVMQNQKDWAKGHRLNEILVWVFIGLEDQEVLLELLKRALQAADKTRMRS
ncbi:Cys/Met metabolism pyridoxal phosphate-dependent enzyme [Penicillium macrosclerotiorum]|uniref:Cys/Met metabolism pyridoxal phosphate-dependent enzyme n=1 Tax=Penicillium macrosclerotiorum TaxID=303699 RepID=UPI002548499D|nr:Cys/Met metabolism pyridoxal phosphate-dependent enzyme [Penicillium macrosclerotiorum]KAJ5673892.1 Cys/Met metabolism pyridoxal phosphate-dependent enzyme [Penicillium macrosclerotiorum]